MDRAKDILRFLTKFLIAVSSNSEKKLKNYWMRFVLRLVLIFHRVEFIEYFV